MTLINAKDFSTRSELENKVRNTLGLTPDLKPDYQIKGTREELARLQLSDTATFWGISCLITDDPTQATTQAEVPARGELQDSGLNGQTKPKKNG